MLDRNSNRKGFTLVELLIIVVLLGILATIAFTHFESNKQKGYNTAAISDLKNAKISLEAYFSENHYYPL